MPISSAPPDRLRRFSTGVVAVATALAMAGVTSAAAAPTDEVTPLPEVTLEDHELVVSWPTEDVAELTTEAVDLEESTAVALGTDEGYQLLVEPTAVLDARSVDPAETEGGRLRVRITDVEGPGALAITTASLERSTVASSTSDDHLYVAAGEATPITWTVTAPGHYEVTVEVAGSRAGGGAFVADGFIELEAIAPVVETTPPVEADDEVAPDADVNETDDAAPADDQTSRSPTSETNEADDVEDVEELEVDARSAHAQDEADEGAEDAATNTRASVAQSGEQLVLDVGHADALEVSLDGSELILSTKDDTFLHADEIVYRDPSEVLFQVLPEAATEVPDNPDFAFLGDPGDTVHLLPMTQDPNLLWPGWSTERIRANQVDGQVQLSITSLNGPGDLKLFTSSTFGGNQVLADSEAGLPGSWGVNVPAHVHANWAFTETGSYTMTVEASATLADGTAVSTGPVEYAWHVGDLDDPGPGGGDDGDGNGGDGGGNGGGDGGDGDGDGTDGGGNGGGGDGDGDGDGTDGGGNGGGGDGDGDGDGTDGNGDGGGSGSGSGSGNGRLAHTGGDTAWLGVLSLLLLAVGALALGRVRRPAAITHDAQRPTT